MVIWSHRASRTLPESFSGCHLVPFEFLLSNISVGLLELGLLSHVLILNSVSKTDLQVLSALSVVSFSSVPHIVHVSQSQLNSDRISPGWFDNIVLFAYNVQTMQSWYYKNLVVQKTVCESTGTQGDEEQLLHQWSNHDRRSNHRFCW